MTDIQLKELQTLEMHYMDAVKFGSEHDQIRIMELILYWLKKQLIGERMKVVILSDVGSGSIDAEITPKQRQEFGILQMELVKVLYAKDRQRMIDWELTLRAWVDGQLRAEIGKVIKPKLKIIRNDKKQ